MAKVRDVAAELDAMQVTRDQFEQYWDDVEALFQEATARRQSAWIATTVTPTKATMTAYADAVKKHDDLQAIRDQFIAYSVSKRYWIAEINGSNDAGLKAWQTRQSADHVQSKGA